MDVEARLALLRRHWEFAATDQDVTHEIYHDDAVLEFPQSGERFEGVENFREWRRIYPVELAFETRRMRGQGDLWIVENSIRYGDGEWQPTANILEFRGDKVAHETIYITEPWEPPEWRARWSAAIAPDARAIGSRQRSAYMLRSVQACTAQNDVPEPAAHLVGGKTTRREQHAPLLHRRRE